MSGIGLEAEKYDRKYSDINLLKRISSYFKPYSRNLVVVVFFLALYSLTSSFVPILSRLIINELSANQNVFYLSFVLAVILGFNLLNWIFNYFRQINSAKMVGGVV
jgi:ABC-type multidrug transport system fused ATPase/permease subunit